jgi:hypothetical protein
MKERKEIEEMYEFVGYFNDGLFMNQDYRKGIQDALSFVLFSGSNLERIKRNLSKPQSPSSNSEGSSDARDIPKEFGEDK